MEVCNGKKYATYILELIRNNGITNTNESVVNTRISDSDISDGFLLFDYFDILYCKELLGENKKYLNYLSIENVFEDTIQHSENYKVSYKTLSLYCKSDAARIGSKPEQCNIFSINNTDENLSSIPFLGIIQISLCRDNYVREKKEEIDNIIIDQFLKECEEKILEIVYQNKSSEISLFQLFRSSTTGDFCLAIRTDSIKEIYDIAVTLNGTQHNSTEKIKMLTFTNVGVECRYTEGKGYATLSKEFLDKHSETVIALRFSADKSLRRALQAYIDSKQSKKTSSVRGLFGRYEYLLYISLVEFADIYPFLCEKKMGRRAENAKPSELEKILRGSCVRNINERILVDLKVGLEYGTDSETTFVDTKSDNTDEKREVFEKNQELFSEIERLEDYKYIFYEEHFAFQDLIRGMKEIYKTFSSTGMDKESYISWCIFQKDMRILCGCIEHMMKHYIKWTDNKKLTIEEEDKKWYRGIVLVDWRNNLQAINRYTTLVQNVNYQTYQSPIYEIQTQIDTEKAMVAYREAMELYISNAVSVMSDGENTSSMVFPIIYPALPTDTVEITAPFQVKSSDGVMPEREILCTVPSFEYFGRLYDLLPWILHETSHHLRVMERGERNVFVTEYIFSYIFKYVMYEPFRQLSDCDFYQSSGRVERYVIDCMAQTASAEIFNLHDFKTFNFETLILNIEKWIKKVFPFDVGYIGPIHTGEEGYLKKQMFRFWLDAYRKEDMLSSENLETILAVLDEEINLATRDKLAKILLKKYYDNLCCEIKRAIPDLEVCLKDINSYALLETKLTKKVDEKDSENAALRQYREQVIAVHRIMKIKLKEASRHSDYKETKAYLEKVFECFRKQYKEITENHNAMLDTVSMHVIRNLGLLREESTMFIKEMQEIVKNVDNSKIMKHKEIRQKIYLETCADLLMTVSLRFTSFGYCRQVLQTTSDVRFLGREYEYEDINYERWRTVTAILLKNEGAMCDISKNGETIFVDASSLIENGKKYCFYTIQHILKKLYKRPELVLKGPGTETFTAEEIKQREDNRALLLVFCQKICSQAQYYLEFSREGKDDMLLLNAFLHDDREIKDKRVEAEWETYKEVAKFCAPFKYNFWRLDCFCRGIANIAFKGKVITSEKLFQHMQDIHRRADHGDMQGCYWENTNICLVEPKRDVGEFYNDPRQVDEKTPDQKLENTIDFIQNFYYFNRFRVVNEKQGDK